MSSSVLDARDTNMKKTWSLSSGSRSMTCDGYMNRSPGCVKQNRRDLGAQRNQPQSLLEESGKALEQRSPTFQSSRTTRGPPVGDCCFRGKRMFELGRNVGACWVWWDWRSWLLQIGIYMYTHRAKEGPGRRGGDGGTGWGAGDGPGEVALTFQRPRRLFLLLGDSGGDI